ncbi:hypothetical protein ACVPOS_08665 [Staphylococcus aureus]
MGIKGFGAYAPEKIIDNAYFEQFLDTSDEWISKMTGIKEKHIRQMTIRYFRFSI